MGPTGCVVAAYVAGNSLPAGHLAELIATVQAAVDALRRPAARIESINRATRTHRQVSDHVGWGDGFRGEALMPEAAGGIGFRGAQAATDRDCFLTWW